MSRESTYVELKIYENRRLAFSTELREPLEVGRQRAGESEPYQKTRCPDGVRLIIAGQEETAVSRKHARFELNSDGTVRVTNLSANASVQLQSEEALAVGDSRDLQLPVLLTLGDKAVRLEQAEEQELSIESLDKPALAPGKLTVEGSFQPHFLSGLMGGAADESEQESLLNWLQDVLGVLESAASSPKFLPDAAKAVAEIVALDFAAVLIWDGHDWTSKAVFAPDPVTPVEQWRPSRTILSRVRAEKRTFRHVPSTDLKKAASLQNVGALVAAPILNRDGETIGAIYGDRRQPRGDAKSPSISALEAKLVELLASGVASGLARLEQEQAMMAARVKFEQFFTPELARKLESEPDMLSGRDAEVSLLFCDISGFSGFSERLGPQRTVDWIKDVMTVLSDCVIQHQGVLVDYIGDELVAMWGAPFALDDHAERACRAAMAMSDCLPELNARWESVLGEPMGFGTGINSGIARVGNIGTPRKFKYGPLGNTVNLASRVQGATKYLRTKLLITGATAKRLDSSFPVRRLCRVRVVNIDEPVELYQLGVNVTDTWPQKSRQYEQALEAFETGDCLAATSILGRLIAEDPSDGPCLLLLSRAVDALAQVPDHFDPVWELAGK